MASSPTDSKTNNHARSNSLPSRPHPLILQCNDHLCRLQTTDHNTNPNCLLSPSSITQKLNDLQDLHECVNKALLIPNTQQTFVQQREEKWVEELLEGSLRLLDACSAAKDAIIHTKECVRDLQSTIRRKWGGDTGIKSEITKYLASRKVVKRAINKALGNIRKSNFSVSNKDYETLGLVNMLREVEMVSFNTFENLLCVVAGQKVKRSKGWSLVYKLMQSKKIKGVNKDLGDGGDNVNEFASVDDALNNILFGGEETAGKCENIESVTSCLERLESCAQDLEQGLEGLFRWLIRKRVAILNVLNK